ncbi:MAG: hypothetical protein P8N94_05885 [Gammaproteobacteria bacterium]|jgi:hypothetical protein|nr:hypothetical protein [Gammaproteobacteria bacterium]MDG2337504.1 hypothetical protein [Gammaproteobacteria bacterium]
MPNPKKPTLRRQRKLQIPLILGLLTLSPATFAGEYSDALSDCLLSSTTEEGKLSLVKWMFTAMALHPAVAEIADVSMSAREQANREMAELLIDLLGTRCFNETRLALSNEGALALQSIFTVLGQVAATNLFTVPNVAAGLASLET